MRQDKDGKWVDLTPEEERDILDIQDWTLEDDDVVELDENGKRILREPEPAPWLKRIDQNPS